MDLFLGVIATLYGLGFLLGLCFFCLHIGLEHSRFPFVLRFFGALLAASLWPLSFLLYGPFMSRREKRLNREFAEES